MIVCPICSKLYFPVPCRWKCPACGYKDSCCEGEPRTPDPRTPAPAD